jgi:hypothetical protein
VSGGDRLSGGHRHPLLDHEVIPDRVEMSAEDLTINSATI